MMEMNRLYLDPSEKGHRAGAIFWGWAEVNDFNRGKPACIDGNLCEGLVDQQRNPTLIYNTFKECIRKTGAPEKKAPFWFNEISKINEGENLLEGVKGADFKAYMKEVYEREKSIDELRFRVLEEGPVLENVGGMLNVPVLISDNTEINISAGKKGTVELLGLTSIDIGYPLGYNYGEEVAKVELDYICGEKETRSLADYLGEHIQLLPDGICGGTNPDSLSSQISCNKLAARLDRKKSFTGTVAEIDALSYRKTAAVFNRQCSRFCSLGGRIMSDIEISSYLLYGTDRLQISMHIIGKRLNCQQRA